jgi:predicted NUDIX family NTP pyrophosphohydrolase
VADIPETRSRRPVVRSAGILLYRFGGSAAGLSESEGRTVQTLEVLIAHMGGPFWAAKDEHAWSIPKGEYPGTEDALTAALREFAEETGSPAPDIAYDMLGEFRQSSGKIVTVFIGESDFDSDNISSNTFDLEWPPRSGRVQQFVEIDRAAWCSIPQARAKLVKGQTPLLDALETRLAAEL